ncbi:sensor histidine kinase [Butyrivibrio sp. VCB2001]|uniref:sensor histidine kinase n=1 Tax=Butyrivibrio sp. VCB2001 TaxID=1280667 RepID=UPI0004260393|nr:histidine kinase [Butyrivibrio sp. VCB2001]
MPEIKYFYTCLELWGSFFAFAVAIYLYLSKSVIRNQYRTLGALEQIVGVMLFFDAAAWFFRGVPGSLSHSILVISNYITILCNAFLPVAVMAYTVYSVEKEYRTHRMLMVVTGIGAFNGLFYMIAQSRNYIFSIDPVANLYHRGAGFGVWSALILLETAGTIVYLAIKRNYIEKKRFIVIMSFVILPLIASILQIFIYGFSLSNIAIIIASAILFGQAVNSNTKLMVEQSLFIENQEKILEDLRTKIALSQIKPHFLYNALNSIYVLCDQDPPKAKKLINNLSEYLRTDIGSIDSGKTIPFTKELDHTNVYLEIEKARFGDRFVVEYDIEVADFNIPPLTIQPLVENAVKHGVCKKNPSDPGVITIRTEEGYGFVKIIIADNGVGFDLAKYNAMDKSSTEKIGISNVRDRLKILENSEMNVFSEPGKGTTVEIIIPNKDK